MFPPPTPQLSIVIPAYNEQHRLNETLAEALRYLNEQSFESELLVVDDGSNDQTGEIALQFEARAPERIRVLRHTPNRGKGFAVSRGILNARGRVVLYCDAD